MFPRYVNYDYYCLPSYKYIDPSTVVYQTPYSAKLVDFNNKNSGMY